MQITRYLAVTLCAALLSGCVTAPVKLSPAPVASYRDSIELSGRLSVNYQRGPDPESLSGKFTWSQTPGRIDVSLASAFSTIARIRVTPESATLVQSDQVARVARDIDTLTTEVLGWSLPVSGLRDWLQGYASGADGKRFVASPLNDSVVTADGWRLRFVSWQDDSAAHPVPKRIDAERVASVGVSDMSIRIVLDPS